MAALGAYVTGRPVKVWLNRDEDMRQTGKRHPFFSRFRAGFSEDGELLALDVNIFSDGGFSLDLSPAVMDRALFHLDGAYHISNVRFCGRVCKTHLPSNTAFRGFGGPQGVFVVEEAINRAAERLGIDPTTLRLRNLYGPAPRNTTHFGQEVRHNRLPRIAGELLESSEYQRRAEEIARINAQNKWVKRGIGLQLVKFGISFTNAILNQAGALLHIYADGTVQLNHGGTEMGQGLHTKMLTVCAHELGVPVESVRAMPTSTEKVPNTSATAASAGSDLNGQAVRGACDTLKQRMAPVACDLLGVSAERAPMLTFAGGAVTDPERPERSITFSELAKTCWLRRVSLSATGYYSTPGIQYDPVAGRGTPFFYFAFGGAVVEVEVHGLTGEHRVIRADILHDVGDSLVPSIDKGQVEGAFVQGLGWLTCEEVLFRADGTAVTTGPSTYKIPAFGDPPLDFRVALLEQASQPEVIHGSKAVGEPPFLLAIGAITALRRAIGAFGPPRQEVDLALPATPEAILRAVERARGH
jgi:xanthine dehydrogenase large subunit